MRTAFRAFTIVVFYLALALCSRADYVLAFHWPKEKCPPCRAMTPTEDSLTARGCDIRRVTFDVDQNLRPIGPNAPLANYYHIGAVPAYVYVITTARGDFDSGAPHLIGLKTKGELARYCVAPGVVGVTSAIRSGARAILSPLLPSLVP